MPATTEELLAAINGNHAKIQASLAKAAETGTELADRMTAVEQRIAAIKPGNGPSGLPTWGSRIANHTHLAAFRANGFHGKVSIKLENAITTPSGVDQRDLATPERAPIQGLPQQRLTVRDLLPASPTTSNLIQYTRQVSRDIQAAPVAEGALKPESNLEFELAEAPVRTIAHILPTSRQTFEDVDGLASLIDNEMRFGLRLKEEDQLLVGDGTDQNILGLIPQATAFSPPFAVEQENALDRVLLAIVQAQQSRLPVDAIIVNDINWAEMISLKDSEGRYLSGGSGGPFGTIPGLLWQVKVIATPSMAEGECLVGAFGLGARLHDRMDVEILVSSEDSDNFRRNMVTIRAEERTALAVRVPSSFVYISELGEGFSS